MKYIDIHCHLDLKDYDSYRDDSIPRMVEQEVGAITIGCDLESSKRAVKIAEESEKTGNEIWACIGIHPNEGDPSHVIREGLHDSEGGELFNTEEFEKLVTSKKVVAIGECG